jgi:hypothetical protein
MKRFGEYLDAGNEPTEHSTQLARAVSFVLNRVVDEINKHEAINGTYKTNRTHRT